MRLAHICALVGLGLLIGLNREAAAQTASSPPTRDQASTSVAAVPVLARVISLQLGTVTVEEALQEISALSGARFSYSKDMIRADERIAVNLDEVTVKDAIQLVLGDLGVFPYLAPGGQIVLAPDPIDNEGASRLTADQQEGSIVGRVVNAADYTPLVNVQVVIVGTQMRVVTDEAGEYRFARVAAGAYRLRAQTLGYTPVTQGVTVVAGQESRADIEMTAAAIALDAVVISATGEQRRRELANAVTDIAAPEVVEVAPVTNMADLLTGRAAGVQVSPNAGTSGTGDRIRIRGSSSVSLGNAPLIYIDGARIASDEVGSSLNLGGQATSRLGDLNPDDIESIEVVKGPSAATLYGTQAANGVIRITTKKGRSGSAANLWFEVGSVTDAGGYPAIWQATAADGSHCPLIDAGLGLCQQADVNSLNLLEDESTSPFRTGSRRVVGGSLSGASGALNYFTSGEFEREDGTLPNNDLKKVSLRANVGMDPRDDLTVDVATGYIASNTRLPNNDNSSLGIMAQGLLGSEPSPDGWWRFTPEQLFKLVSRQRIRRLTQSATAVWQPTPWLSMRGSGGLDVTDQEDVQHLPPGEIPRGREIVGRREANRVRYENYTAEFNATGSFDFTQRLNSQLSIGLQFYHEEESGTLGHGEELVAGTASLGTAALTTAEEFLVQSRTLGAFVQEQLGLNDRLFLTAAVRGDDNSAFGEDYTVVVYPKVSASWVISEEPFFPESGLLGSLRLRAAWGQSGNQPGVTDALLYMTGVAVTTPEDVDAIGVTFEGGGLGNPDLKPERSAELEAGIDAQLLSQRVSLEFTYYDKRTRDALIFRDVAPSVGTVEGRFENIGETSNRGVELMLQSLILSTVDVSANLLLTGSMNTNELVRLGEGVAPIAVAGGGFHKEGYSLGGHWAKPILDWNDANGDGIIVPTEVTVGDTVVYLGPSHPTRSLSIQPTVTLFDRFTLAGLLDYRGGHYHNNATASFRCGRANDRARNDPTVSLWEQTRCVASAIHGTSAGYVEDAEFLKLREVSLTFSAPERWARGIGASGLRLTVSGRNLKTWTGYTGVDPEINRYGQQNFATSEFLTQAPSRYWMMRLNVRF